MDIAPIKGLIDLENNFSTEIKKAIGETVEFKKETEASLSAVATAAGLVTGAFIAIGTATLALGNRGADVNDLDESIEHFAGSARAADAAMDALRQGTLGTVKDFDLAKEASHLLSAGVKLNAEDFNTLGSAAFVLQNRGLGGTKEMLDLVSESMVSGRTKALAMALGVVDAGDAEFELAQRLGTTVDMLSDSAKVEARRSAVMDVLRKAVADAGDQERDFGEQLEFSQAALGNWIDDLGSAVAKSEAFKEGMNIAAQALQEAFGSENTSLIQETVGWLEEFASVSATIGIAMVEVARVVHTAWSAIEVIVLAATGSIVQMINVVTLGKLGLGDLTAGLVEQAKEAAKGITQTSEFDKTLDEFSGTLFQVKDALDNTKTSTEELNVADDIAKANAKHLADLQEALSASMLDRAKVEKELASIEKKSIEETKELWDEYAAEKAQHGFSSFEAQRAQVDQWAKNEVEKLEDTDRNWQKHYDAIQAVAKEKLEGIRVDWDLLREKSITTLREKEEVARATYNEMILHANQFSRAAIAEQKQAVADAAAEVRGLGKDFTEAQEAAKKATEETTAKLKEQQEAAAKAAAENRRMGGSFDVTAANIEETARGLGLSADVLIAWAKLGYSFEHAIAFARKFGLPDNSTPPGPGPRIPGFAQGGVVDIMTGEQGPEVVRVPLGSQVFQTGTGPADEALWHRLNEIQARMWLEAGRVITAEQQAIIDIMKPLTPEGYGSRPERSAGSITFGPGSIVIQGGLNDERTVDEFVQKVSDRLMGRQVVLGRRG